MQAGHDSEGEAQFNFNQEDDNSETNEEKRRKRRKNFKLISYATPWNDQVKTNVEKKCFSRTYMGVSRIHNIESYSTRRHRKW